MYFSVQVLTRIYSPVQEVELKRHNTGRQPVKQFEEEEKAAAAAEEEDFLKFSLAYGCLSLYELLWF